jgi:eukaryotic-like serine/threonine-protein kinase
VGRVRARAARPVAPRLCEAGGDRSIAGQVTQERAPVDVEERTGPIGAMPAPGDVLARRYRVVRLLGRGGMGAVYEVMDGALHEPVALKLLHPGLSADPTFRQRLREEVRLAHRVSHPNVCRVHDLGQHGDHLFVAMELLRGPTLREMLRAIAAGEREPLSLARAIDLIVQLAAALGASHRAGVVHRDVKPDNVIVEADRAVLTDFGVAGPVEIAASRPLLGTPAYIAPELLRGEPAGPASDLYACALVACELLTGQLPPSAPPGEWRPRDVPPAVPDLADDSAPPLARAALVRELARALDPDPGARHTTVPRFAEAMALAARGAGGLARADPPPSPPGALPAREPEPTDSPAPRVAVALHLAFAGVRAPHEPDPAASDDDDTRPLDIAELGELDRLERLVRDHGGTVTAGGPGELVALFGAPRALGDDVVRAARAAHALIERCHGGRAGLDTGRVELASRPGRARDAGDAARRARELAGLAGEGEVVASALTTRHLLGRFDVSRVGAADAGGAHVVRPGLLAGAARYDLPPLYGRASELARLERFVLEACERRAVAVALVAGPAGSGKSRLRLETERRVSARREVEWLVARASPLGGGVPLGLLQSAAPDWYRAATEAAAGGRAASFAAARRWLVSRASLRPVIVVAEDVQWADGASIELLGDLRRGVDQVPVVVVLFARSDADAPQLPIAVDLELSLPPLDAAASRAIAARLVPDLAPEALADIVGRAGGSPFFLEELARDAAESGGPTGPRGGRLPASVELAIQARLDRLPPPARRVVHAASVVGREFDRAALVAALGAPVAGEWLDRALVELERRQLVTPVIGGEGGSASAPAASAFAGGERYAFHHVLVRDVAYAQMEAGALRRIHAAIADHLDARGAAVRRDPAMRVALARHRDAAGDRRGARDAYMAAGELALELAADQEARDALLRAEELGDEVDLRLDELLGDTLVQLDSAAAMIRFERALAGSTAPMDRARLLYKLGCAASHRADYARTVERLEQGLALLGPVEALEAAERPVRLLAARILGTLGWVIGHEIGDHRRGSPHAERAVALLEDDPDLLELALALSRLAANYLRAGRWHDRLRCNLRHLDIAQALADPERELMARVNLGVNYHSLGQIVTAIEHTRRAQELAAATGRLATRALVHNNLGVILVDAGEDARARDELDQALALAARAGYHRLLPEALATLARIELRAGDQHAAESRARAALDHAREAGAAVNEGMALRILAGVLARGDRRDEVEQALAAAERLLVDERYELARTWVVAARWAARLCRDARAAELRERARLVFQELGAAIDLARLDDDGDLR